PSTVRSIRKPPRLVAFQRDEFSPLNEYGTVIRLTASMPARKPMEIIVTGVRRLSKCYEFPDVHTCGAKFIITELQFIAVIYPQRLQRPSKIINLITFVTKVGNHDGMLDLNIFVEIVDQAKCRDPESASHVEDQIHKNNKRCNGKLAPAELIYKKSERACWVV